MRSFVFTEGKAADNNKRGNHHLQEKKAKIGFALKGKQSLLRIPRRIIISVLHFNSRCLLSVLLFVAEEGGETNKKKKVRSSLFRNLFKNFVLRDLNTALLEQQYL